MPHIYAALVQEERAMTLDRTQLVLAARKAQGASRTNLANAQKLDARATKVTADTLAANALPLVRELLAAGVTTLRAIVETLNAGGLRTARLREWHHSTARDLLAQA